MPTLARICVTAALMLATFHATITRAAIIKNFYNHRGCTGPSYECHNVQPQECCWRLNEEIVSSEFINLPEDSFASIYRHRNLQEPTACHGEHLDSANGPNVCLWRPTVFNNRGNGNGLDNTVWEYNGASYELYANVMVEIPPPPGINILPGIGGLVAVGSGPTRRAVRQRETIADRRTYHDLMKREDKNSWLDTGYWEGYRIVDGGVTRDFDPKILTCEAPFEAYKRPCKVRQPDVITFGDGHQFNITGAPGGDVDKLFNLWKKEAKFADIPKELQKYEMEPDKVTFRLQDWKRKEAEQKPLKDMNEDEQITEALKAWDIRGPEFDGPKKD